MIAISIGSSTREAEQRGGQRGRDAARWHARTGLCAFLGLLVAGLGALRELPNAARGPRLSQSRHDRLMFGAHVPCHMYETRGVHATTQAVRQLLHVVGAALVRGNVRRCPLLPASLGQHFLEVCAREPP